LGCWTESLKFRYLLKPAPVVATADVCALVEENLKCLNIITPLILLEDREQMKQQLKWFF